MREKIKYVTFDVTPIVCVRVIEANDTKEIKAEKKKYPFKLHNDVPVTIITNKRIFGFTIPKKYIWNGADIPRSLWRLVVLFLWLPWCMIICLKTKNLFMMKF